MSTESLAIVGLTIIALALPLMGAWFYQVFALRRDLADVERRIETAIGDVERRLSERTNRLEDDNRRAAATLQQTANDWSHFMGSVERRIEGLERGPK